MDEGTSISKAASGGFVHDGRNDAESIVFSRTQANESGFRLTCTYELKLPWILPKGTLIGGDNVPTAHQVLGRPPIRKSNHSHAST